MRPVDTFVSRLTQNDNVVEFRCSGYVAFFSNSLSIVRCAGKRKKSPSIEQRTTHKNNRIERAFTHTKSAGIGSEEQEFGPQRANAEVRVAVFTDSDQDGKSIQHLPSKCAFLASFCPPVICHLTCRDQMSFNLFYYPCSVSWIAYSVREYAQWFGVLSPNCAFSPGLMHKI